MGGRDPRAALILRMLGGQHLHDFLPGNDNAAARRSAVRPHGWTHGRGWAEVTSAGVGVWPHSLPYHRNHPDRRAVTADLFLTWPQVFSLIARACEGTKGSALRAAYEAAFRAWVASIDGNIPGREEDRQRRAAEQALVEYGCRGEDPPDADAVMPLAGLIQGTLFDE
jgi:hypothetical protein